MSTDIFDFPPVERPYVAVRRFKLINGEFLFNDLLEYPVKKEILYWIALWVVERLGLLVRS